MSKFKTCASLPANFWQVKQFVEYDADLDKARPILMNWLGSIPYGELSLAFVYASLYTSDVHFTCEQSGITAKGDDIYKLDLRYGARAISAVCTCIEDLDGVEVIVEQLTHTLDDVACTGGVDAYVRTMVSGMVEAEILGTEEAVPTLNKVELSPEQKELAKLYQSLQLGTCYLADTYYEKCVNGGTHVAVKRVVIAESEHKALEALVASDGPSYRAEHALQPLEGLNAWVLATYLEVIDGVERPVSEVK